MRWYSQALLRAAAAAGRKRIVVAARPSTAGTADEGTGIPGSGASWVGSARLTACPPARLRATAATAAGAAERDVFVTVLGGEIAYRSERLNATSDSIS